MKPHHVIRDAPVASAWWMEERLSMIREATPDQLEGLAQKIVPHGWGAIRKVRGGIEGKKAWLCWALVLQRAIAVRGCELDWEQPERYQGDEFSDPLRIYAPLIAAARAGLPGASAEELARSIREQVPSEDWTDEARGAALIRQVEAIPSGLPQLPPGVLF